MRPQNRAQQVVGRAHVGHPIPDGLVDGILQRPAARLHRPDCGAQQPHPKYVRSLPLHVDRAHVDHALDPQQRAGGSGRHAVLSRSRLGHDTTLSHAPGQQRLPQRVVDLMRAGMRQVLPLQIDLRAAQVGAQATGEGDGRRAPHVRPEEMIQLLLEGAALRGVPVCLFQLVQRGHQRLRHELAAIGAEPALRIRLSPGVDRGLSLLRSQTFLSQCQSPVSAVGHQQEHP